MSITNKSEVLCTLLWRVFALLVLWGSTVSLFAQQPNMRAANWFFHKNLSLSFTWDGADIIAGGVSSSISPMQASWGCSSISTPTGDLLFYTNGQTVWGSNHQPLTGGTGLHGEPAAKRSSIIIPKPGLSASEEAVAYYIFYTTSDHRLKYATIKKNGGNWEVYSKNTLLGLDGEFASVGEVGQVLTACQHGNGVDYWLLAHEAKGRHFYLYKISQSGVGVPSPGMPNKCNRYFTTDQNETEGPNRMYAKFSPNGRYVGVTIQGNHYTSRGEIPNSLIIYSFDNSSGIISERGYKKIKIGFFKAGQNIPYVPSALEFSAESQYVYVAANNPDPDDDDFSGVGRMQIFQYRIGAYMAESQMPLASDRSAQYVGLSIFPGDLQLALDGNIYLADRYATFSGLVSSYNEILYMPALDEPIAFTQQHSRIRTAHRSNSNDGYFSLPNTVTSYLGSNFYTPPCDECIIDNVSIPWSSEYTASVPPPADYSMGGNIIVQYQTRTCNSVKELRIVGLITDNMAFPLAAYSPDRLFQYLEDRWLKGAYSNSIIPPSTNADDRTIVRFHFWRCWNVTLCDGLIHHWWPCSDEICCYREYEVGVDCDNNAERFNMRSYTNVKGTGNGLSQGLVSMEIDRGRKCSPKMLPPSAVASCSTPVSVISCQMLQCERLDPTPIP